MKSKWIKLDDFPHFSATNCWSEKSAPPKPPKLLIDWFSPHTKHESERLHIFHLSAPYTQYPSLLHIYLYLANFSMFHHYLNTIFFFIDNKQTNKKNCEMAGTSVLKFCRWDLRKRRKMRPAIRVYMLTKCARLKVLSFAKATEKELDSVLFELTFAYS